jgi:ABC-type lipoprotein release transport system permease subunit
VAALGSGGGSVRDFLSALGTLNKGHVLSLLVFDEAVTAHVLVALQFIIEAMVLTSTGGALAILLGAFVTFVVKILVGIYPAFRASRLDPGEAMRHEC